MHTSLEQCDYQDIEALLPASVHELLEVIGFEKTMRLVAKMGGIDFLVPLSHSCQNAKTLAEAIGSDAAQPLMEIYGGTRVYIPRCEAALIALRNQSFRRAIVDEMEYHNITQTRAIKQLAPRYGFTERRAYDILKASAHQQNQLF